MVYCALLLDMGDPVSLATDMPHTKPMGSSAADTTPSDLRQAETKMGSARSDSAQSPDAGGGLPDDCPPLQSAVGDTQTDDGE
jgi:hypothetical protein